MFNKQFFLVGLSFLLIFEVFPVYAQENEDPLKKVLESDEFKELDKSLQRENNNDLTSWVDPESHYGQLLLGSGRESILSNWINTPSEPFFLSQKDASKKSEYLTITHTYTAEGQKLKYYVQFFIPYPKYGPMSTYGLVSDIEALKPPGLRIKTSEKISIGNIPGTLFHEIDNNCSVLIPLPRYSFAQGRLKDCTQIKNLMQLLSDLNLENVVEKLQS